MRTFKKIVNKIKAIYSEYRYYRFNKISIYRKGDEYIIDLNDQKIVLPENSSVEFIAKIDRRTEKEIRDLEEDAA